MQIERYRPKVKYSSIPYGETFEFEETLYIKLEPRESVHFNSVVLKTGQMQFFDGSVSVVRVSTKVVLI